MKLKNVPGNRLYITRKDEGEGVLEARELGQEDFRDSGPTGIAKRLARAAKISPQPRPALVAQPRQQVQRQRPRRLYVPVDEYGAATRFEIIDRTTGLVMARCYGSAFHVAGEAVRLCKSQRVSDRDFILRQCS